MHKFRSDFLILLLAVLSLLVASCDRKPNDPITPKEYVFWTLDYGTSDPGVTWIFRYEPATNRFDTLIADYEGTGSAGELTSSANGDRLYMPTTVGTAILDTDSLAPLGLLEYGGHISVSPDGRFIAFCNGSSIRILRSRDHSLFSEIPRPAKWGIFDRTSSQFYAISNGLSPTVIYRFSLRDPSPDITEIQLPHGTPGRVVPIDGGSRLLVYLHYYTFDYAFADYSLQLDSFLTWHPLTPGAGELTVASDESVALVTNPGTLLIGPPAPSEFLVYDIKSRSLKSIETLSVIPDTMLTHILPVSFVSIAPDNSFAVLTGKIGGTFIKYDIKSEKITAFLHAGNNIWLHGLTCRLKP